jgi:hypothetical protein
VERLAGAVAATVIDLLPAPANVDPLPVLKEQANRMLSTLLDRGDPEAFIRLNPILALLVEAASRRG